MSPVLVLDIDVGLPVEETIGVLDCLDSQNWSGLFRRSLTPVGNADGEKLLQLLPSARTPSPVRVPRKRPQHTVTPRADPERLEPEERSRGTQHLELVANLIKLGRTFGCDVWIASDERGKSHDGFVFAEHVLDEFPSIGLDPESKDLVRTIDVLWIRGRAVNAAFEVEATTSVYSGLLRMSDLVALQPNTSIDLYIVAPDERGRRVRDQIVRPTFEAFDPPLRSKCRFLSASSIDRLMSADPRLLKSVAPTVVRDYAEVISSAD